MGDDVSVAFYGSDTRQRRAITNFIQHPNFDKETMANDIAVIRVRSSAIYTVTLLNVSILN